MGKLTEYQKRFVDAFMELGDKRKALYKAGYQGKGGYSNVTSMANRMYNNPKVYAEIERRRNEVMSLEIINSSQIVGRLTRMFNGELTVKQKRKDGSVTEKQIGFKEQIEAAKLLVNILGIQAELQKKEDQNEDLKQMADELKKLTDTFLSRRVVIDGEAEEVD